MGDERNAKLTKKLVLKGDLEKFAEEHAEKGVTKEHALKENLNKYVRQYSHNLYFDEEFDFKQIIINS